MYTLVKHWKSLLLTNLRRHSSSTFCSWTNRQADVDFRSCQSSDCHLSCSVFQTFFIELKKIESHSKDLGMYVKKFIHFGAINQNREWNSVQLQFTSLEYYIEHTEEQLYSQLWLFDAFVSRFVFYIDTHIYNMHYNYTDRYCL